MCKPVIPRVYENAFMGSLTQVSNYIFSILFLARLGMRSGWEQARLGMRSGWEQGRLGMRSGWVQGRMGMRPVYKQKNKFTTYVPAEYGVPASYLQLGCH